MAKDESSSDRDRSRKSSKTEAPSSKWNAPPKKPSGSTPPIAATGDRLRPPVSTTSSLARKMDEARLEKKRLLVAAAQTAVEYEENDAATRAPESDLSEFVRCCEEIRDSLGQIRVETDVDIVSLLLFLISRG